MNFSDCGKNSRVDGRLCRVGGVPGSFGGMLLVLGGIFFPFDGRIFLLHGILFPFGGVLSIVCGLLLVVSGNLLCIGREIVLPKESAWRNGVV